MANRFFVFALVLVCCGSLQAQSFFGPRLGFTLADVDFESDGGVTIDYESEINLQIGLALDLGITRNFSIQPELTYLGRGYSFTVLGVEVRRNIAYMDLGALAKFRVNPDEGVGFYLGAGPIFSYAISGKDKFSVGDDMDIDFDDTEIKRTDVSLAGALGLTFNLGGPLFFVDGRYILGLSDTNDSNDVTIKNRTIAASVGFMIPL